MMKKVVVFTFVIAATSATSAWAQAITAHSGALNHGSSVTLTVTGAGTKTQNTQLLWDPMNGTNGSTDIEGRTPAGTQRWLVSGSPRPQLSNAVVRPTPGRTTSVFMQQSGGIPPPTIAVGGGTTENLSLTAASLPNRQALGNGPLFFSAWINYTKDPVTTNIKTVRYWSEDGGDAPGIFWFPSANNPPDDDDAVGHNRFYDVGLAEFGDANWHQTKHLFQWNTLTYIRIYFDNRLVVDTDPPGHYNAPGGGFTEGPWGNLAADNQIDSYGWESQGNASGGGSSELYYVSDLYVDKGYNRVELCNANTYSGSNHCEMQPYTAWPNNNGSLTINLNRGTFAANASVYLYLCNASDVCGSGYAVTLGGVATPTAPTNLRIVPGSVAGLLFVGFAGIALLTRRKASAAERR